MSKSIITGLAPLLLLSCFSKPPEAPSFSKLKPAGKVGTGDVKDGNGDPKNPGNNDPIEIPTGEPTDPEPSEPNDPVDPVDPNVPPPEKVRVRGEAARKQID